MIDHEARLVAQHFEQYSHPERNEYSCRPELQRLQNLVEQGVNTFEFADEPKDETITVDPNKPTILKIGGITTVMNVSDTSARIEGRYTITRDAQNPSKLRVRVRPNQAVPTPEVTETNEEPSDPTLAEDLAEFDTLKAEIENKPNEDTTAEPEIEAPKADTRIETHNGNRTLILADNWKRVRIKIDTFPNPVTITPNLVKMGDLRMNGYEIERDPQNPNQYILRGKYGMEIVE